MTGCGLQWRPTWRGFQGPPHAKHTEWTCDATCLVRPNEGWNRGSRGRTWSCTSVEDAGRSAGSALHVSSGIRDGRVYRDLCPGRAFGALTASSYAGPQSLRIADLGSLTAVRGAANRARPVPELCDLARGTVLGPAGPADIGRRGTFAALGEEHGQRVLGLCGKGTDRLGRCDASAGMTGQPVHGRAGRS